MKIFCVGPFFKGHSGTGDKNIFGGPKRSQQVISTCVFMDTCILVLGQAVICTHFYNAIICGSAITLSFMDFAINLFFSFVYFINSFTNKVLNHLTSTRLKRFYNVGHLYLKPTSRYFGQGCYTSLIDSVYMVYGDFSIKRKLKNMALLPFRCKTT